MDISKHKQFLLSEIKVNKPKKNGGSEGYKRFIHDYLNVLYNINLDLIDKYRNNEGLGEELINKIMLLFSKLYSKYRIDWEDEYFRDWLNGYLNDIGLPRTSSGSLYTALNDDESIYSEYTAKEFDIDEEEAYDIYEEIKNNY